MFVFDKSESSKQISRDRIKTFFVTVMEAIKVSGIRYLLIQVVVLLLVFVGICIPVYRFASPEDESRTSFIALCSVGLYLLMFGLLKGAEMPVRVTFNDSELEIEMRFFFWTSTTIILYEDARIKYDDFRRLISLYHGKKIIRFDPLLWSRSLRKRLMNAFELHSVQTMADEKNKS